MTRSSRLVTAFLPFRGPKGPVTRSSEERRSCVHWRPRDTLGSAVAYGVALRYLLPVPYEPHAQAGRGVPMKGSREILPPEPPCAACSKPIRSGSLVMYEHGELFHLRCRTRIRLLSSLETLDRAQTVRQRAGRLIDEARQKQDAPQFQTETGDRRFAACPLCAHSATVTDWRPGAEWIAIEECPCRGYFVWAPLLAERVRGLPARNREDLAHRIRAFRAMGHEAWLTTLDATVTGPVVIRTARPDRRTQPQS
jgi:hypothetical protein